MKSEVGFRAGDALLLLQRCRPQSVGGVYPGRSDGSECQAFEPQNGDHGQGLESASIGLHLIAQMIAMGASMGVGQLRVGSDEFA